MTRRTVYLVTGATAGIGRALAAEIARRDVDVVVHGRTAESAERAAAEIGHEVSRSVERIVADLSSMTDPARPSPSSEGPRRSAIDRQPPSVA